MHALQRSPAKCGLTRTWQLSCVRASPSTDVAPPPSGFPSSGTRCRRQQTHLSLVTQRPRARHPPPHLFVRPWADSHTLLQAPALRLDFRDVVHQPTRHRLDALAVPIEQEPRDVVGHRLTPFWPTHPFDRIRHTTSHLVVESLQLASAHADGRSVSEIAVKVYERVVSPSLETRQRLLCRVRGIQNRLQPRRRLGQRLRQC